MVWMYQRTTYSEPDYTHAPGGPDNIDEITEDHPLHYNFTGEVTFQVPRPYLSPAYAWLHLPPFLEIVDRCPDSPRQTRVSRLVIRDIQWIERVMADDENVAFPTLNPDRW